MENKIKMFDGSWGISGPRQSGKSTRVVYLSAMTGATIITNNRSQVLGLMNIALDLGLKINKPILYTEVKKGSEGNYIVDDAEYTLHSLLGVYIIGLSYTTTENNPINFYQPNQS